MSYSVVCILSSLSVSFFLNLYYILTHRISNVTSMYKIIEIFKLNFILSTIGKEFLTELLGFKFYSPQPFI